MSEVLAWIVVLIVGFAMGTFVAPIIAMPVGLLTGFALLPLPTGVRTPVGSFLMGAFTGFVLVGSARLIYGWIAGGPVPVALALIVGAISVYNDNTAMNRNAALKRSVGPDAGPASEVARDQLRGSRGVLIGDVVGVAAGVWLFALSG